MEHAFQDLIDGNHCFGCGRDNPHGLRIKSYWDDDEAVCIWTPQPWHCASPTHVVNGGIIAALIDCHAIISTMAWATRAEGRTLGDGGEQIWFVTGKLDVQYLKPTPLGPPLQIRAKFSPLNERKVQVACTLAANNEVCATGEVLAVRVPTAWMQSA